MLGDDQQPRLFSGCGWCEQARSQALDCLACGNRRSQGEREQPANRGMLVFGRGDLVDAFVRLRDLGFSNAEASVAFEMACDLDELGVSWVSYREAIGRARGGHLTRVEFDEMIERLLVDGTVRRRVHRRGRSTGTLFNPRRIRRLAAEQRRARASQQAGSGVSERSTS